MQKEPLFFLFLLQRALSDKYGTHPLIHKLIPATCFQVSMQSLIFQLQALHQFRLFSTFLLQQFIQFLAQILTSSAYQPLFKLNQSAMNTSKIYIQSPFIVEYQPHLLTPLLHSLRKKGVPQFCESAPLKKKLWTQKKLISDEFIEIKETYTEPRRLRGKSLTKKEQGRGESKVMPEMEMSMVSEEKRRRKVRKQKYLTVISRMPISRKRHSAIM